ncbi:MAG: O-antigen ligase family protein [Fuerstiella sp.]
MDDCKTTKQQSLHNTVGITQKAMLVLCLVLVPLTNAWATEWGLVVLLVGAGALVVTGVLKSVLSRQYVKFSFWPLILAGAACCIVLLQVTPLPASLLEVISPVQSELFADWAVMGQLTGGPPRWATISLVPHLTMSCLTLVCSYFLVVWGLWYFLESEADVLWLVRLVAISVTLMAGVGVMQLLFEDGKYLGLFENPMRPADWPAKGTFTNQNHFANFLAVGLGCCFYQVFGAHAGGSSRTPAKKGKFAANHSQGEGFSLDQKVWAGALVLILLAGVLTFSRGGIFALFVAFSLSCFAFRSRLTSLSSVLIPAFTFVAIALLAFGAEGLVSKWNSLITSSSLADVSSGRVSLWKSLLEAAPQYAMVGTGAGSHAEVYPLWMKEDLGVRFSHAENGYLQIFLETGSLGLLLLAGILFLVFHKAVKSFRGAGARIQSLMMVCVAGIVASLLHSFSDFAWYIPACLLVTLSLLMILFRLAELVTEADVGSAEVKTRPLISSFAMAFTCAIVVLGMPRVVADARSEPYWLKFRSIAIGLDQDSQDASLVDDGLNQMIDSLENCLVHDPSDSRALSDLSVLYLQRFEVTQADADNPISLAEIRSTVKSVGFESRKEMFGWMTSAFPDGLGDLLRSALAARKSIQGQPLRASSYLTMHQLSFLTSDDVTVRQRLMDQVLRVRPHDAAVRYASGAADLEEGRLDSGFDKINYAFHHDQNLQSAILNQLIPMLSIQEVVEVLDPDVSGLYLVFAASRDLGVISDLQWVAEQFREKFAQANHPSNYDYWFSASQIFSVLKDHDTEAYCLQQCLKDRPRAYSTRRRFAFLLADIGDIDEAVAALKACLLRKADDVDVKKKLEQLTVDSVRYYSGPSS